MAKKLMKNIPISFNLLDPDQDAMYQHVCKRSNRSGYLKRLIQRDMDQSIHNARYFPQQTSQFDEGLMKGLI